jgi:hypothetical protein
VLQKVTDPWVSEYEWLKKNLNLLGIDTIELGCLPAHSIASELKKCNHHNVLHKIPPERLDEIKSRFESFSGLRVVSIKYKDTRSFFRKIALGLYNKLTKR